MQRIKMCIAYDGTEFAGSQLQRNVRTVQGELQDAIDGLGCRYEQLALAGRTDSGVHAVGQVVSADVDWADGWFKFRRSLNAILPRDISILTIDPVDNGFHARFDAKWREYRYRIFEADAPPVLDRRFALWRREELDSELARDVCDLFVGTRPMGTFAGAGKSQQLSAEKLTRTIYDCEWRTSECRDLERHPAAPRRTHEMRIIADGFLPNMVRNIVSTIMSAARGDVSREWVQSVIAANDRRLIGAPAPPEGLLFWRVGYENRRDRTEVNEQSGSDDRSIWRGGVSCR